MSDEAKESIQECTQFSKEARKNAEKMGCSELLEKINELTDTEKRGRMGTKGLVQRFRDYLGDDATHGPSILNQQRSLRTYLDEYDNQGCGDPPGPAVEVADRKLPVKPTENLSDAAKAVAVIGGAGTLGYAVYRAIRFLPSLAPPLWWTIPENFAIP